MAIEEEVLGKITRGEAKMRPKAYFALRTATGILIGVIVLLLMIYLAGFAVFALRESGVWYEPEFGLAGWSAFFTSLPWALIGLVAILLATLAAIMHRYPWGYRWPIVYSLLGALCLIAAANLLIIGTSLRREVFSEGVHQRVPVVGAYYPGFAVPEEDDIHRGFVQAPLPGGFVLMDLYGATSAIEVSTATFLEPSFAPRSGEEVVVFGDRNGSGTIRAIGVGEISPCTGCSNQ